MLTYFVQYWSSDNTKPLDNLKLHYGSSFLYPVSTMGAHVSEASPMVPFETKAAIAMCGTFGYELDATKLKKKEIKACKKMSALYHKYYDLNFFGDYYRLANPFEQVNLVAWETVAKDKSEALVTVITVLRNTSSAKASTATDTIVSRTVSTRRAAPAPRTDPTSLSRRAWPSCTQASRSRARFRNTRPSSII